MMSTVYRDDRKSATMRLCFSFFWQFMAATVHFLAIRGGIHFLNSSFQFPTNDEGQITTHFLIAAALAIGPPLSIEYITTTLCSV